MKAHCPIPDSKNKEKNLIMKMNITTALDRTAGSKVSTSLITANELKPLTFGTLPYMLETLSATL